MPARNPRPFKFSPAYCVFPICDPTNEIREAASVLTSLSTTASKEKAEPITTPIHSAPLKANGGEKEADKKKVVSHQRIKMITDEDTNLSVKARSVSVDRSSSPLPGGDFTGARITPVSSPSFPTRHADQIRIQFSTEESFDPFPNLNDSEESIQGAVPQVKTKAVIRKRFNWKDYPEVSINHPFHKGKRPVRKYIFM